MAQKGLAGHQVCVAVCCSVLVCVAVCCGVLRAQPDPFARRDMTVDCNTHYKTLQHTATHCNTLQHTATHCNTLQHTAIHCNTLQHTATRRNTLQHTTPHSHCTTLPRDTCLLHEERNMSLLVSCSACRADTHDTHEETRVFTSRDTCLDVYQ